jgi:hypothetical protein
MIDKISLFLQRMAKGWLVLVLLGCFFLTILVVFPAVSHLLGVPEQGVESIDTTFYYSPGWLYDAMQAYGPEGRAAYALGHFTGDLLFPVVYTLLLACSISWVFHKILPSGSRLHRLNMVPVALFFMDLLENSVLVVLLLSFPKPLTLLAGAAGVITLLKWLLVGASMAIPLVGLLVWLVRILRKKSSFHQAI